ncbi:imidazoleglycerol-phosphate dehydratase HisB [Nanoarchaeota archaeon]
MKQKRTSKIERKTNETSIKIKLNIDGKGKYKISTGIGFLDHMLETFAKHGLFDLEIQAKGDLHVDQHHLVEDLGIVIGEAFANALGNKKGINRTGYFVFPMDEALAIAAVDIANRPFLGYDVKIKKKKLGELELDTLPSFFEGFVDNARVNVHLHIPYGRDAHHMIEAMFKALAKAMKMACSTDPRQKGKIPSTKGKI